MVDVVCALMSNLLLFDEWYKAEQSDYTVFRGRM